MTIESYSNKSRKAQTTTKTGGLSGFFSSMFHSCFPKNTTKNATWTNWAKNQSCRPADIFYPETLEDLKKIVNMARTNGKKVRCAASGHSWSSTSVTDGYLVVVNKMENVYSPVYSEKEKTWTVQLETGVLVKDLDNVLRDHNPPLTLPSNVVLDSVRYGGVLSLGCHGAATHTRTLPDLVSEVTIIDANGNLNTFSQEKDAEEFSAACVNLGLLGVIYSYTLRVEPMFKLHMTDTYPPLSDYFASPNLCGPKLKAMVLANDQTEIFYWPFNTPDLGAANDRIWVKQWQRTTVLPVSISKECEAFHKLIQGYETQFGEHLYEFMAKHPSSTPFVNCLLFKAVGNKDVEQVLEAPDAIHYQAGIDNLPCVDLEMAFKVNEDFSNVVIAWNYVIEQLYEYASRGEFPFNLTLEMRFVKSSSLLMSAAYDTDPEAIYCMIEILSVNNTKGFDEFSSKIAKFWMDNFRARPHWAKMWEHVPGIVPYLRQQDSERYDRFEVVRRKYDPNGMFMNSTFAGVLGH
ncbi:hypothetical protein BC939DRAFT_459347 [Gamsiella multidivaricata]|uniref:uncharacterized protein n=1 Tax=Gamsiella multidivaricata TaxID=101098 RepID=UPI00222098D0|nr:uncharacterized protein BC939DRAFT_459347 [Gamsiella multidivaricata]KAG0364501.1 hypothetical protein BGZ54_007435 [Gamsiella multidivaricata]KAI7819833.1 hypothetical protein BC939DRAFT_459347 [Gamsiella multidivaricata]